MYRVILDGLDRGFVENVLKKHYGRWITVDREPRRDSFNIVLSKCERSVVESYNVVVSCIDRVSEYSILRGVEHGRALLRQWITWSGSTYRLAGRGEELIDYDVHPAYDLFIWRSGFEAELLREKRIKAGANPLIHKRFGGEHIVYSGPRPVARLKIPDYGLDFQAEQLDKVFMDNDLEGFIEENKHVIIGYTRISRKFLESLGEPDHVVVSFSGGKDSLVTLDLAVKHYGGENISAIYVDTGVDFPETIKYVEKVSDKLGVSIDKAYAPVREEIRRRGLPTKINRWCTLLKTRAFKKTLEKYVEKYKKLLVLVGDRDTESLKRARKPPVRKRRRYLEAAPIKQWSTIHVQLYTWFYKLPENPLYKLGFYRLGCYICPALTGLEKYLVINRLYGELKDKQWFREFLEAEKQSRVHLDRLR